MDTFKGIILLVLIFILVTSFYHTDMANKESKIEQLTKERDHYKSMYDKKTAYIDSIMNSTFKFKVKETGGKDVIYIFNRESLIKTNYDVDTTYFNKLYKSSSRYDEIPFWLVLYYAHIENKITPYNKHGRIERSYANAYNIMQVTWQAMHHVNTIMGKNYKWKDVKFDVDTNIDCGIDYMKTDVIDAFYAFDQNPKISYWFYNGGPNYAKRKLKRYGLLNTYLTYLKTKKEESRWVE